MDEIKKYLSEETVDEVIDKFEAATGTVFSAILPVIISGSVLLLLSIWQGMMNASLLFGVLFGVCMIPLWILGVGAFSFGSALYRLIDSVNFLFLTTVKVSAAVYRDKKALGNGFMNARTVCQYSFQNIILPVLKTVVKRRIGGKILLKFIESVFKRIIKPISGMIEEKFATEPITGENTNPNGILVMKESAISMNIADRINTLTKTAVQSIRIISRILSVLFALAGIVLTAILFAVHAFVRF